jgi:hypothetical protein
MQGAQPSATQHWVVHMLLYNNDPKICELLKVVLVMKERFVEKVWWEFNYVM